MHNKSLRNAKAVTTAHTYTMFTLPQNTKGINFPLQNLPGHLQKNNCTHNADTDNENRDC